VADEQRRRWRNWSGEQRCRPLLIQRPRTREGLIAFVIAATEQGRSLKAAGSGHSFTGAALTDGVMLDVGLLNRVLDWDPAGGRVKVEAGIVLGELNRRLDRRGLALENLGDIDRQTLAGSISTGTHGTGAAFRNLSSQVEALEIVTADGTLHTIDGGDADALRAARIGIGALGIIYSATLRTITNFRIDRTDRARPLGEVLDGLDPDAPAGGVPVEDAVQQADVEHDPVGERRAGERMAGAGGLERAPLLGRRDHEGDQPLAGPRTLDQQGPAALLARPVPPPSAQFIRHGLQP
jgi:hypothetical protein